MAQHENIEQLVRELYGLAAIKRDTQRRAIPASAMAGLSALAVIERHGPLRMSDVADALHVNLSVASRQIAALALAGHVHRWRDPEDGRSQRVAVTDMGREALRDAHARMVEAFAGAVTSWSDDEIVALASGLARLREDYAAAMAPATLAGAGR